MHMFPCVHYLFRSVLYSGHWSTRGCEKNSKLSNYMKTFCECNHLTHFAILLSPNPPKFQKQIELSLSYIGTIGVTISFISMSAIVIIFASLKLVLSA